jgi:hypothetical protein
MPTLEDHNAMEALELQLRHYQNLLDQSIREKDPLIKTQGIYHELKIVSDQLHELKKLQEEE